MSRLDTTLVKMLIEYPTLEEVPFRYLPLNMKATDTLKLTNEAWYSWDRKRLFTMFIHYYHCTQTGHMTLLDNSGTTCIIQLDEASYETMIHFCIYVPRIQMITFNVLEQSGIFYDRMSTKDGYRWSNKVFLTFLPFDDASIEAFDQLNQRICCDWIAYDHLVCYYTLVDQRGLRFYRYDVPLLHQIPAIQGHTLFVKQDFEAYYSS